MVTAVGGGPPEVLDAKDAWTAVGDTVQLARGIAEVLDQASWAWTQAQPDVPGVRGRFAAPGIDAVPPDLYESPPGLPDDRSFIVRVVP